MTPDQQKQNEAIANELGWKIYICNRPKDPLWIDPKDGVHADLPNFLEQINIAIAEDLGWKHINSTGKWPVGMDPALLAQVPQPPAVACVARVPSLQDLGFATPEDASNYCKTRKIGPWKE